MSIFIAILIFGIIIVIHELGHFIMARKCGVLVEEFAIGMGPILYKRQKGETLYSLRLFPIGGFCRMLGEDDNSGDTRAFSNKTLGQRAAILSFGAFMNILLAFVIFLFVIAFGRYTTAIIREVFPGTPIEEAGLMAGDRIVRVNNTPIYIFEDVSIELSLSNGEPMDITYVRDGQRHTVTITPEAREQGGYWLGFSAEPRTGTFAERHPEIEQASIFESLMASVYRIRFFVRLSIVSFVMLVTGQLPMDTLAGPIGIVTVIDDTYRTSIEHGESAAQGIRIAISNMLNLTAIISANIGVLNLLPVPALDGGRLLFILFELIRRKPVPVDKEGIVHFVGFVLLMIFAVFVAYNDIMRIFIQRE